MQQKVGIRALSHLCVGFESQSGEPQLQDQIERLLDRLQLAVIFGGNKIAPGSVVYQSHNTRSWKSYEAVAHDIAASLGRLGFRNVELMPDDMRSATGCVATAFRWPGSIPAACKVTTRPRMRRPCWR